MKSAFGLCVSVCARTWVWKEHIRVSLGMHVSVHLQLQCNIPLWLKDISHTKRILQTKRT